MPESINKSKALIVEGEDDAVFFSVLIEEMSDLDLDEIQILPVGGKNDFGSELKLFKKTPGFSDLERICILRDSHDDPEGTFRETKNIMSSVNLPRPSSHSRSFGGGRNPKILIGLIPSPNQEGELEHLCIETVKDNKEYDCTASFMRCIKNNRENELTKEHKAEALTYIASQTGDIKDFRHACHNRVWDYEHSSLDYAKSCLNRIF